VTAVLPEGDLSSMSLTIDVVETVFLRIQVHYIHLRRN
jgi:hypothetical protein